MQNTQSLQLFTKIIKTESIYKSYSNGKLEGLVEKTKMTQLKEGGSVSAFNAEILN